MLRVAGGHHENRFIHTFQSDVRAVHGAAGRRRQRPGGDGPWRDPDRQVVGDHAGRSNGLGRVLRAQGPSRVRAGPGGARAIGLQSGRLQQRARGHRRPRATCPRWLRFSDEVVWPNFRFGSKPGAPYLGQPVPGDRRGRTREAGCARRQLWRRAHAQPDVQGVVGSRRSS